jgi:hypothetical protein
MRFLPAFLVLSILGLADTAVLAAEAVPAALACHTISRADFDKALAEAKAKPGAKVSTYKYVARIIYAEGDTADFFTRGNNRAHPAYVRRSVTINGSDITIDTQGYTAGATATCARWLKGFVSQNGKIKAAIAKAPQ